MANQVWFLANTFLDGWVVEKEIIGASEISLNDHLYGSIHVLHGSKTEAQAECDRRNKHE